MPSLGATMEEGTITTWRFEEGDTVESGQIICELESDKSTFDFESPCSGTLRKIIAAEGQTVPVQQIIAVIGDPNENIPVEWLSGEQKGAIAATAEQTGATAETETSANEGRRVKISPKARKLAQQLGIDIEDIKGSGPGGRIESGDIEKAAHAVKKALKQPITPFGPVRRQVNAKVTQSKQQIPHFYIQTVVDMTGAAALREKYSSKGTSISYNALLMKAVVSGLEAEPSLNMEYCDEGLRPRAGKNVGLAIETPGGVIIAVIDDVDKHEVVELSQKIAEAVNCARQQQFHAIKMSGACMTISNLGRSRVETFMPIIHPGESAILGIGSIADRPVVANDLIVRCKTVPVTMCVDHRIADGAVAARFLEAFASYLEHLE